MNPAKQHQSDSMQTYRQTHTHTHARTQTLTHIQPLWPRRHLLLMLMSSGDNNQAQHGTRLKPQTSPMLHGSTKVCQPTSGRRWDCCCTQSTVAGTNCEQSTGTGLRFHGLTQQNRKSHMSNESLALTIACVSCYLGVWKGLHIRGLVGTPTTFRFPVIKLNSY